MTDHSDAIPSSFDHILLNSELEFIDAPPSTSFSDDLAAIQECIADDLANKTKAGIVIQHRIANTLDAFRSEEDHPIDTPLKHLKNAPVQHLPIVPSSQTVLPSSPPAMPLISSPPAYPASSLPVNTTPKKRKRSDAERSPLKDVPHNNAARRVGAFLDDSDDEEDIAALKEQALKRRAMNSIRDLPSLPDGMDDYTPPASQSDMMDPETVSLENSNDYLRTLSLSKDAGATRDEPTSAQPYRGRVARTASGKPFYIPKKVHRESQSYEQLIASRSVGKQGQARQSYYGINIHRLIDQAKALDEAKQAQREACVETTRPSVEQPVSGKAKRTLMWTEKYRAKKFTDLVGDERTHRAVLRWLKAWDTIVFPGSAKQKPKSLRKKFEEEEEEEEQRHRKILLLTGPPGLGKTTLAHVCARQAGYEVQEINASDERSRDVVKGRIRDMVGTENVRGVSTTTANGKVRKAGKPVCVVVDEVDGVVSGSGGSGEGGFVKALIDLINLDEKNSKNVGQQSSTSSKRKKGDRFRLLRPLILICNDVYHPSLRPLRQSSLAEVIHIRKPALNMVVSRMQEVFVKEGIQCDSDGVRRLCEATWGVSTKKEGGSGSGTGEGDIRGVMVVGEWVAGRFRSSWDPKAKEQPRLSRRWIEDNIINDLGHGGGAARSLGRGGAKDVVDRVFREGAGFPKQAETTDVSTAAARAKQGVIGVAEAGKKRAMARLREMVDTSGDCDRIVTDCFAAYPGKPFQDDNYLTKPTAAYEWLHFHDTLSAAVHGSQEWELAPYLSQSVLAFHDLFASPRHQSSNPTTDPDTEASAFSGPNANYTASEELKKNKSQLMALQSTLSLPLARLFRSPQDMALELIPYTLRMLSPDVKPVIVNTGAAGSKSIATAAVRKASEKVLVKKAVEAMAATGVRFERSRVEFEDAANRTGGWVFRMEPPLDSLASFETLGGKKDDKVRYAVRSVLETEWKKESMRMDAETRKRRGGHVDGEDEPEGAREELNGEKAAEENRKAVKRDFFGRIIKDVPVAQGARPQKKVVKNDDEGRIWVSFHEGFSNAVRKPITIDEFMRGL